MRILAACASLALLALSGCASVYVSDPGLAKQADTADAAVVSADTLKPYATQLANLDVFSAQQDLAVAERDVATRDAVVAQTIGAPEAKRLKDLSADACRRLVEVVGGDPCSDPAELTALSYFAQQLAVDSYVIGEDQRTLNSSRAAFERLRQPSDPADDDCDAVAGLQLPAAGTGTLIQTQLSDIQSDCKALNDAIAALDKLIIRLGAAPDKALRVAYAATLPPPKAAPSPNAMDAAIKQQIAAAASLAKTGDVASLAEYQKNVEIALKDASAAAKIVRLGDLQKGIGDLLTGTLCSPPPKSGVDCSTLASASTSGRAASVWSLMQAIAQNFDANDPRMRSANWLAAANAILAAEKTDAKIQVAAERDEAASADARFQALGRAATSLAKVALFDRQSKMECPGAPRSRCATAAYLDAWNTGLTPADVLAYRDTLILRRTIIKKQLAAQTEQQSLARAASASLKAYADGGVQPATIAQLIFDAGLLGVAATK